MKPLAATFFFLISATTFAQQKETFDLATFTVPKGWKKVEGGNGVTGYAITNNLKGAYCQIAIYKSMGTLGNAQLDFDTEWNDLVVKPYKPTSTPEMVPGVTEEGWEAKAGVAPFDYSGGKSIAMLVTMSGYSTRMSIVILTNTEDYQTEIENFLGSVDLKKPQVSTAGATGNSQPVVSGNNTGSVLGTWAISASDNSSWRVNNGVMSTIWRQYDFNANGTYTFISKTFDPLMDKLLLGKENGTFQITGNTIAVIPQKSVLEAWSKKDGTDKWGNLLSTQSIALEKTSYQFTQHYFSGIQEWHLVLQSGKPTVRDGPYSGNSTFANAWYYRRPSNNNRVIELPEGQQQVVQQKNEEAIKQPPVQPKPIGKFAFNTTNFDDGWVATEQDDWAQVTKGNIKVLVHYPNKAADAYSSDLMEGLKNAWNVLVAPKYSSASNFEFKPISSWQSIEFAEADMVEKGTGKMVHVVLFRINYSGGERKYVEFITPDKNSFEQEFGAYHNSSDGWEKMEKMAGYNKFAVSAQDLNGKWTNNFSGMIQYVNAYTGLYAGATSHASTQNFEFAANGTYQWDLSGASGMVGNLKFQTVKSTGKHTVPNNWQIKFSDLEGKPRLYNAYFSCIKGARILWLQDTGYGDYSSYGKVE